MNTLSKNRDSKLITDKAVIDKLLNVKVEDITQSYVFDLFGTFDGKTLCHQYDMLKVPPGYYTVDGKKNKNTFVTTAGIWLFNKYFIEPGLTSVLGYINEPITSKRYKKINKALSYALMEDRIDIPTLKEFLEKTQEWTKYVTPLAGSWSYKMLTLTSVVNKKKEELCKKYQKELDAGDIVVAEKVQKELLQYALDYMGDDPSLDGFLSGAGGSIDNNFMSMYVMKGAIRDQNPDAEQEYHIAKSNYMDGISADEYSLFASSLALGPVSRAVKTASGGWWEKLMISAHQHLVFGKPGSDCGTKNYVTVTLTPDNLDKWIYSYMVTPSGLVELTSQNASKYFGKKVKFRFASMCKMKGGFCNKCAGNLFYRQGITNGGLVTDVLASKLKNICMKYFHDSTVTTVEMNPWEAFSMDD